MERTRSWAARDPPDASRLCIHRSNATSVPSAWRPGIGDYMPGCVQPGFSSPNGTVREVDAPGPRRSHLGKIFEVIDGRSVGMAAQGYFDRCTGNPLLENRAPRSGSERDPVENRSCDLLLGPQHGRVAHLIIRDFAHCVIRDPLLGADASNSSDQIIHVLRLHPDVLDRFDVRCLPHRPLKQDLFAAGVSDSAVIALPAHRQPLPDDTALDGERIGDIYPRGLSITTNRQPLSSIACQDLREIRSLYGLQTVRALFPPLDKTLCARLLSRLPSVVASDSCRLGSCQGLRVDAPLAVHP